MLHKNTAIAVIGAGPAGTATVGALLEKGYSNILWIDPYFLGG
jgi:cation diffusion facilitator CzcD-associated flavoprotein CzcO